MDKDASDPATQYLVGSVWPTNRTGVLGDTELDPKLPPSIRFVHLSMEFARGNQEEFRASMPGYEAKVAELAARDPDLIRVIGAPPFMLLGYKGERETIDAWENRYGIPMVTSGQNHVRAFRTLGVRRIVGASYFPEELNALFRAYLTDAGFEVLGMEGIGVPFADVPNVPSSKIQQHLTDMFARHPGGECIYMLGSAWKTLDIIEPLEATLGVPVVHALPARCWETQARLGLNHPILGYGHLLAEMPKPA
jgi:maleate isomerase